MPGSVLATAPRTFALLPALASSEGPARALLGLGTFADTARRASCAPKGTDPSNRSSWPSTWRTWRPGEPFACARASDASLSSWTATSVCRSVSALQCLERTQQRLPCCARAPASCPDIRHHRGWPSKVRRKRKALARACVCTVRWEARATPHPRHAKSSRQPELIPATVATTQGWTVGPHWRGIQYLVRRAPSRTRPPPVCKRGDRHRAVAPRHAALLTHAPAAGVVLQPCEGHPQDRATAT